MVYDSPSQDESIQLEQPDPTTSAEIRMQKTPGTDPEGLSIPTPFAQSSPSPPAENPVSASEELK